MEFILTLIPAVAALIFYRLYTIRRRDFNVISVTPTTKLSKANGYVEIAGKQHAWNQNPLISHLKKVKCTWYKYEVEVERISHNSKGHTKREWKTVESGQSDAPIVFGDGSGYCLIDTKEAEIVSTIKKQWYGDYESDDRMPKGLIGNIAKFTSMTFGRSRYRFTELLMMPESYLYAIGEMSIAQSGNPIVQDWVHKYPDLRHIVKGETVKVLSGKGLPLDKPFIISGKSEQELLKQKKLSANGYLLLAIGCACLTLYLINIFFI